MLKVKKGDKSSAANYWPISLTYMYILCKEHSIASSLVKHLDTNGLMCDLQHGFRKRHSCEMQLASLLNTLCISLAVEGKQTDLILLDFSKNFEEVNHSNSMLILKLHSYGIRGSTLCWI